MTIAGGGIGLHRNGFRDLHSENLAGGIRGRLGLWLASPPPRDQAAPDPKQRRRVLGDHVESGDRAGSRYIKATEPICVRLGPALGDGDVVEVHVRYRSFDERTFAAGALDEHKPRVRQSNCKRKAGNPGARAEVHDLVSTLELMEVQGNERIRNVIVDDPPWVPNRRRRKGIFRQQPYERLERATCPFGEPESRRQGLDLRGNRTWQL